MTVRYLIYSTMALPSVQQHLDGVRTDALSFSCAEFDKVGSSELIRQEIEEGSGGTAFAGQDIQCAAQFQSSI